MEKHINYHQPQRFSVNSDVMIDDLHPSATGKWHNGASTITKILEPLNYEVKVCRWYTHQAHIDHILPCPQITSDAAQ